MDGPLPLPTSGRFASPSHCATSSICSTGMSARAAGHLGRERCDRRAQFIQLNHEPAAKRAVISTVAQQDVSDRGKQRGILARQGLNQKIGIARGFRPSRVDDNDSAPARLGRFIERGPARRFRRRQTARSGG